MNPKQLKIHLKSGGIHTTDRSRINFHEWGIDAVIVMAGEEMRVHIPWGNIDFIAELI